MEKFIKHAGSPLSGRTTDATPALSLRDWHLMSWEYFRKETAEEATGLGCMVRWQRVKEGKEKEEEKESEREKEKEQEAEELAAKREIERRLCMQKQENPHSPPLQITGLGSATSPMNSKNQPFLESHGNSQPL